jgi:hypothetical protein
MTITESDNWGNGTQGRFTVSHDIERDDWHAAVLVFNQQRELTATETPLGLANLNPATPTTGRAGNLGYVFVETNFEQWDLIVSTANGGFLMRAFEDGDDSPTHVHKNAPMVDNTEDLTCTGGAVNEIRGPSPAPGILGPVIGCQPGTYPQMVDPSFAYRGAFLRIPDGAGVSDDSVIVTVGIGTIGGFAATDSVYDVLAGLGTAGTGVFAVPTRAESFVILADLNDPDEDYKASVAQALAAPIVAGLAWDWGSGGDGGSSAVTANTATNRVTATGQFVGTSVGAGGDITEINIPGFFAGGGANDNPIEFPFFTPIVSHAVRAGGGAAGSATDRTGSLAGWNNVQVNGEDRIVGVGAAAGPVRHRAMGFYVNARLTRVDGTTAVTADQLMNALNDNGSYTEDIIFTFWGTY